MGGWLRYFVLRAQVRAGMSAGILIWAAAAAIAAALALIFLLTAAFLWLAEHYGGITAGLTLAGFFVLLALIAIAACVLSRRRNIERARLELAARGNGSGSATWLDPKLVAMGFQIGRAIGWRKLASLAAVAVLAAGLTREWIGRKDTRSEEDYSRAEGE